MEHEVAYDFEDEGHFWTGNTEHKPAAEQQRCLTPAIVLDETISRECDNHGTIDDTLRSYLTLIGAFRGMLPLHD